MLRRLLCVALIVFAGVSCSRDPEVVKKKYLQNGNRYFEKGKYKEAYIMYRNALKKDPRYSEAYYRAGLTELRLGEPVAALRDMRRAADTDPNFTNPDARAQEGNPVITAYVMNDSRPPVLRDELRSVSSELLKHNPKSAAGLRLRGYLKLIAEHDAHGAVEDFRLADQITPYDPDIVLPLVQALQTVGQGAEAEKLAKALIEKHKDFIAIYDVMYMSYLRANRNDDAEAILKLKAANNPKDAVYLLQLAQYYYRFNRHAEMQQTLDRLLSNRKAYPMAPLQVARFYGAARDYDEAMKQLQEGARTDSEHKADYQKEIAQVLVSENRKDEAVRLLEQILKANPKDERAQAMRSSLLIETGDPRQVQQAITELQAAVTQDSQNPVLRFNLGRALLAKNLIEQARVQFQEALKIRREYVPARLALAQLFIIDKQYASAVQTAKEVLDYDPRNLTARLVRTSALAAMGNSAQARSELAEAVAQFPTSAEAQLQLGVLDLAEKRFPEAEQRFRQVYHDHPADLRALMGIAETYTQQDQHDKAIQLLQGELAKYPARLELKYALGNVAVKAKKWDLAIEQFEAIIAARPDAGDVYVRMGQMLAAKGDYEGAARTFEKAKQMRPNDPDAYLQSALLLEQIGKRAQARPVYEQVLKLQPDSPIALNNLAYLLAGTGSPGDLDQALQLAQRARQKLPDNPDIADTLGWIYIKKNLTVNAVDLFRDLMAKESVLPPSANFATFHYHYGMALVQRGDKLLARKELKIALERKPSPDQAAKIRELLGKIG
jgi:tetratricopeptide (TPR) repeat protein